MFDKPTPHDYPTPMYKLVWTHTEGWQRLLAHMMDDDRVDIFRQEKFGPVGNIVWRTDLDRGLELPLEQAEAVAWFLSGFTCTSAVTLDDYPTIEDIYCVG